MGWGLYFFPKNQTMNRETIDDSAKKPPTSFHENPPHPKVPPGQCLIPQEQGSDVQSQRDGGGVKSKGLAGEFLWTYIPSKTVGLT
jgi:hypothetical protein